MSWCWAPLIVSLVLVALTAWSRRSTIRCLWQGPPTVMLILLLVTAFMLLVGPYCVGPFVYGLTGLRNISILIGYCCALSAVVVLTFSVVTRTSDETRLRAVVVRTLQIPLTLGVALLMALYWSSDNATRSWTNNLFYVRVDLPLALFWTLLSGLAIYFLAVAIRGLLILRRHPAHRWGANFYLATCLVVAVGCLAPILHVIDSGSWTAQMGTVVFWTAFGVGGVLFVAAHSRSVVRSVSQWWRIRSDLREFRSRLRDYPVAPFSSGH